MAEENETSGADEYMRTLDNERRSRTFYETDLPQDIIQEISNSTAKDAINQFANSQISTCEFVQDLLSIIKTNDMQMQMIRMQSGTVGFGMMGGIGATSGTLAAMAMSDDNIEKLVLLKSIVSSMKTPLDMKTSTMRASELDPYMDKILKEIYTAISEIAKTKAEK